MAVTLKGITEDNFIKIEKGSGRICFSSYP